MLEERRKFIRVESIKEAYYRVKDSYAAFRRIEVRDLSLSGISVYLDKQFADNTRLELRFTLPKNNFTLSLEGNVIWQLRKKNDSFASGISFSFLTDEQKKELQEFIQQEVSTGTENRRFVRYPFEANVKYSDSENPGAMQLIAKSLDISGGGMRLLFKEPLKQGVQLQLVFSLSGSRADLSVSSKVVWIRAQAEGQWEAGLIFTALTQTNKEIITKFFEDNYRKNEETGGAQ